MRNHHIVAGCGRLASRLIAPGFDGMSRADQTVTVLNGMRSWSAPTSTRIVFEFSPGHHRRGAGFAGALVIS